MDPFILPGQHAIGFDHQARRRGVGTAVTFSEAAPKKSRAQFDGLSGEGSMRSSGMSPARQRAV